ncbi:MAG: hypothetical protein EAZ55_00990 [Cytophagales bacterium]|nr:MAG: hypothetical protein EAZ55_00990 [Cytophagales bacterium]
MEELNLNQEQKRKFREAYLNQQQKEKEEEEKRYQYKYEPKSENVTDKFDAYWKKFEDKYGKDFYEKYQQQQQHQNTNYDQKAQQDLSKLQTELKKNAAILGVKETATFEEIKTAYKNLMKKYHPDKFQNDPQKKKEAEEKSSKINVAYEFFKKREQKAAQK